MISLFDRMTGLLTPWNSRHNAALVTGDGFDVTVQPGVTAGAYLAGDIMGGLMEIDTGLGVDVPFLLNELQFAFKSAVTPSLLAVILNADPVNTARNDNDVYSLPFADVFKVRRALPIFALGGYLTDHGTPNTIVLPNIGMVMKPAVGTSKFYFLLPTLDAVTLATTNDLQVRASGTGL